MRLFFYMLMSIVALTSRASAADPDDHALFYRLNWNRLLVGTLVWTTSESKTRYTSRVDIKTSGLVRLFAKHISYTQTQGIKTQGEYVPASYTSYYQTRKKKKIIDIAYAKGSVLHENFLPAKEREVGEEWKKGSVDPLTLLLNVESALTTVILPKALTSIVYDGRTAYKALFSIKEKQKITVDMKEVPVIHVTARREPLAGFDAQELAQMKKGEPLLHLYFADTAEHTPLRFEISGAFGTFSGTLLGTCAEFKSCATPPAFSSIKNDWENALRK